MERQEKVQVRVYTLFQQLINQMYQLPLRSPSDFVDAAAMNGLPGDSPLPTLQQHTELQQELLRLGSAPSTPWRYSLMTTAAIMFLQRPDVCTPLEVCCKVCTGQCVNPLCCTFCGLDLFALRILISCTILLSNFGGLQVWLHTLQLLGYNSDLEVDLQSEGGGVAW